MNRQVDLFWSFRSPYSYLATPRLVALQREFHVDFALRPVYPIALRIPGFFKKVNPLWPPYLLRDCARIAEMHGMHCVRPRGRQADVRRSQGLARRRSPRRRRGSGRLGPC